MTVRGTYDGKSFRALPQEPVPAVHGEVPVTIVFWERAMDGGGEREHVHEVAKRMRTARHVMPPLEVSTKDLIEEGRER